MQSLGMLRGGMRVLVWQWGRRGAGPRFAASLADGLRLIPGTEVMLSLSSSAEILRGVSPPLSELPIATYTGLMGLAWRLAQSPLLVRRLARQMAKLRLDVAICAMPGPLDLLQLAVLRRVGVPAVVVVHDADAHPGDSVPVMLLQRRLTRRADIVVALSEHVAARLREQGLVNPGKLIVVAHPPFMFGPMPPPFAHGGALRLLCFGRLLPYKGLDLLASAIRLLGTRRDYELRVVGSGPESSELASLRGLPGVRVENRWVPEDEVGALIAWADVLVLPYKEASQSGIAPTAIAAGRFVVSTRVGGLVEQLQHEHLARLHEPDAASLAAALRELLDSPPGKRPGSEPSDPALAWRNMAELLLDRITASGSTASHRPGSVVRLDSHLLDGKPPNSTDIAPRSP
jgi:glycosyltransferase involved in cell wall biosynthesis